MAWAGTIWGEGICAGHGFDVPGVGVEMVLEESVVAFDVRDVEVAIVWGDENGVCLLASLVPSGGPFEEAAFGIEFVGVDGPGAVICAEEESSGSIGAEVGGAVFE